ncbi:MAG: chemotaxis protein CheX [Planctomycetota bacterium]|nr:MAG: chemotaxis protein CheX [Planctomycetota bacterium]
MDPNLITPFMQSVQNVFSTMLQLPVEIGEPAVKADAATTYDVSGIIGMSGDVVGAVVLSFPKETAERIVALFTGQDTSPEDEDFADAIGELVNMVAGGAKGMFQKRQASISCPSVVIGKSHIVSRPKGVPCISIPCETDCGSLCIEVGIRDAAADEEVQSQAA